MPRFIRRNQLVISGKFHPRDWHEDDEDEEDVTPGSSPVTAIVSATSASPCVFTWGAPLPFEDDEQIILGGVSVPAGFTAGTTYYAVASNEDLGTFELALAPGGAPINSTSTGVGVTATLVTDDLPFVQPSAVTCLLHYHNTLDQEVITTIAMTMDSDNRWSGTWDSTDAKPGRVEWTVFSTGPVAAATEGSFELFGNNANIGNLATIALFEADEANET